MEKVLIFDLENGSVHLKFYWIGGSWVCHMDNEFMEELQNEMEVTE